MNARRLAATFAALFTTGLLLKMCNEEGRMATREAAQYARAEYPFLFSPPGYDVSSHWARTEEFQLLVISGRIVFARRPDAKPLTAEKLRRSLLRSARQSHFERAHEDVYIDEAPPASELDWIRNAGTGAILDVIRTEPKNGDASPPKYVCRIWISPDGSRYAAAYSTTN